MTVIGLGSPDSVRVRFERCQLDVLVDVLREQRRTATLGASETYHHTPRHDTRAIDDRHDTLRALEALLIQLENLPADEHDHPTLVGPTELLGEIIDAGARDALRRLETAYERYEDRFRGGPPSTHRDALRRGADTAHAWITTLTNFAEVDDGTDE